jgi:hypothetical protein
VGFQQAWIENSPFESTVLNDCGKVTREIQEFFWFYFSCDFIRSGFLHCPLLTATYGDSSFAPMLVAAGERL